MKFRTKIDFKTYKNLVFHQYYHKPGNIMINFFGLVIFIFSFINFFGIVKSTNSPYLQFTIGIIILFVIPIILYFSAKKNYQNYKILNSFVDYEFIGSQMSIAGEGFKTDTDLSKALKIIETKNWFIIYETKQISNLLPKETIGNSEQQQLREFFQQLKNVKLKLKTD